MTVAYTSVRCCWQANIRSSMTFTCSFTYVLMYALLDTMGDLDSYSGPSTGGVGVGRRSTGGTSGGDYGGGGAVGGEGDAVTFAVTALDSEGGGYGGEYGQQNPATFAVTALESGEGSSLMLGSSAVASLSSGGGGGGSDTDYSHPSPLQERQVRGERAGSRANVPPPPSVFHPE